MRRRQINARKTAAARAGPAARRFGLVVLTAPLLILMATVFVWKGVRDRAAALAFGETQISAIASELALAIAQAPPPDAAQTGAVLAAGLEAIDIAPRAAALLLDATGARLGAAGDLAATPLDRARLDDVFEMTAGAAEATFNGRRVLIAWRGVPGTEMKVLVAAPAAALAGPGANFFSGYGLIFLGVVALFLALLLRTQRQSAELSAVARQIATDRAVITASLDRSDVLIWRTDRNLGRIHLTAATARFFGLGDEARVISLLSAFRRLHREDRAPFAAYLRRANPKKWAFRLRICGARSAGGAGGAGGPDRETRAFDIRGGALNGGAHAQIYGVAAPSLEAGARPVAADNAGIRADARGGGVFRPPSSSMRRQ